ncbi:hypothetical protein [Rubrivirga sp. IMCC45206]|uniref:hypothetical protein n=1 Tax=Rubrivirga sp. IMCC45206 TaxID=3391614 RepID=UPI00398FB7DA
MFRPLVLAVLAAVLAACGGGGPVDVATADAAPLRLDRDAPEKLLRSVLGPYAGGDPFASGLVAGDGDDLTLALDRLPAAARAALVDANGDGVIDWDELAAMLEATYGAATGVPATLAGVRQQADYLGGEPDWFTVNTDGVMTAARRRIHVPVAALRAAMETAASGGELVYPAETWIVGEHLVDGAVVETTAKRKRADGFWDFAVYDADGRLAPATQTEPRALRVPTQCTGCHLGERRFEPEKSFPGHASDGPFGPRAIHVPEAWRSADATRRFDEHARRADGVLGLYATLYAGRLMAERERGPLAPDDAALLDRLGL